VASRDCCRQQFFAGNEQLQNIHRQRFSTEPWTTTNLLTRNISQAWFLFYVRLLTTVAALHENCRSEGWFREAFQRDIKMRSLKPLLNALVAMTFLASSAGISSATEQAQQRRAGRDVKQETRQNSRVTKQDCRAANEKSNAACRQDKRHTKQQGRQQSRDIKY